MVETISAPRLSSAAYEQRVPVNRMSEPGLDLAACVERVRQRDEDAARRLMQHLYPLVLKLVRAHLPKRSAEEDLVQMVFVKVFAKLDQFNGAVPLEHWVSRIAINTCINQIKAERVRPELRWADLGDEERFVVETLAATESELDATDAFAAREIVEKLHGAAGAGGAGAGDVAASGGTLRQGSGADDGLEPPARPGAGFSGAPETETAIPSFDV